VKVLVVDDHALVREGVRQVLVALAADIAVLEAGSSAQALQAAAGEPDLDLVLLDLKLPDRDGMEALRDLREQHPAVPVVVMSGFDEPALVLKAIDNGAMGFIPKSSSNPVLLSALRLVLAGGVYLPPAAIGAQPGAAQPQAMYNAPGQGAGRAPAELGLTERQSQVLALLVQGMPNKLICRELDISEKTVKQHVGAILRALRVDNRTQAVVEVSRLGIRLEGLVKPSAPRRPLRDFGS